MTQRAHSETELHGHPGSGGGTADSGGAPGLEATLSAGGGRKLEETSTEISLLDLAGVVLKRWRLVLGLPALAVLAAILYTFLAPSKFTATAAFVPEAGSSDMSLPSGLAGLASQFGLSVPTTAGSPAFYADVLESRSLRDQVLLAMYPDPRTVTSADSTSLLDILGVSGENEAQRLEKGREELAEATVVSVDAETSIVSVSIETGHRALSADVANRFIEFLNRFNADSRQSSAHERRVFIETRLEEAERELRLAEEDLQRFLERNRQYQGSPDLRFQYERLQRQVLIKTEVLTTLRRQYEEARIQEVNDTQVITVIDSAVPPEERSSPKLVLNVAVALLLGSMLSFFGAFGLEFVERARAVGEEEFEEVASQWDSMKSEVRSLISKARRLDS